MKDSVNVFNAQITSFASFAECCGVKPGAHEILFVDRDLVQYGFDDVLGLYIVRLGFVVQNDAMPHHISCYLFNIFGKHVVASIHIGERLGRQVQIDTCAW